MPNYSTPVSGKLVQICAFYHLTNLIWNYFMVSENHFPNPKSEFLTFRQQINTYLLGIIQLENGTL
jgi:hypothetical protein